MLEIIPIILVVLLIAFTIFILSYTAIRLGWHASLEKPFLYYENWIYSPIWFLIYAIVVYSWYRINSVGIIILFSLQLVLLLCCIVTFFYYRNPANSIPLLIVSILILLAIIVVSVTDPLVILLLSIYLIWLLYLLYIVWQIAVINP